MGAKHLAALVFALASASASACGDSTSVQDNRGGTGGGPGSGGAAGSAGTAGTSGSAGADAGGQSGSGGDSGSAATAGNGASGGATGSGGSSGSGGNSGTGATGGSPGCGLPVTPGQTKETLDVGGLQRTYLIVVPASVDGRTPAPVILGFHGGNGTAEAASQYGLTGTERALYVYPQALEFPEAGGVAWNVSRDGNDDEFFDALLIELGRKHCVDTSRVFAAGQSNGAFFVNQLGCYRPDALRAIAPVAGGGPSSTRECTKGVSAMMVHGTADQTVRIEQGIFSRTFWLAANGCSGAPSAPTQPAPCVAYTGCAKPILWCEHGGGHPWPSFAGAAIRSFFLSF